jgi:hypothetical protein
MTARTVIISVNLHLARVVQKASFTVRVNCRILSEGSGSATVVKCLQSTNQERTRVSFERPVPYTLEVLVILFVFMPFGTQVLGFRMQASSYCDPARA